MTIATLEKLREYGWYLTEPGLEIVSDYGSINDLQKIIKRATDVDLKEIGSGEGDLTQGSLVLQIQKLRNVAAPKSNEESRGAPRLLKISLTDGKNSYQAVELENIGSINLNTPPGTKLLLRGGNLPTSHGMLLLSPSNIVQVLGGKVASLVEKWELNKKLASHTRVRPVEEGGPPPWIPFGKKIIKVAEQGKSFKALADKEKCGGEENAEFEAQRKNAIAEAAKQGSRKVFGGGTKQLLDHSVQKIVDQGYTIDQAEYALKVNRNNVERALRSLQKNDNKSNSNSRDQREPREPKGKRGDKKSDEGVGGKPSSGKISLFDFLEDKLPARADTPEASEPSSHQQQYHQQHQYHNRRGGEDDFHGREQHKSSDGYAERYRSRGNDAQHHLQGGQSVRGGRGKRGYQVPPRHLDENRSNNKYPSSSNSNGQQQQQQQPQQYSQYGGGANAQKTTKPPRFQRNQDSHANQSYSGYQPQQQQQQQQLETQHGGNYGKFPQVGEFRNAMPAAATVAPFPRQDAATPRDFAGGAYKQSQQDYQARHQQDYQTKVVSNSQNQSYRPSNNVQQSRGQEANQHPAYPSNTNERNYKGNRYYNSNTDNLDYQAKPNVDVNKSPNNYFNSNARNDEPLGGTWVWRIGDRCMAKYWEDNMYYNAEVTAVSQRTCVVQFKEFHNYEEVLQEDCIPITEDSPQVQSYGHDNNRRSDHRSNNRPPRFEQNQNSSSNPGEYRRGGGAGGNAGKNFKRRGQQRSAQPIYQPPAQRGGGGSAATYLPQNNT